MIHLFNVISWGGQGSNGLSISRYMLYSPNNRPGELFRLADAFEKTICDSVSWINEADCMSILRVSLSVRIL